MNLKLIEKIANEIDKIEPKKMKENTDKYLQSLNEEEITRFTEVSQGLSGSILNMLEDLNCKIDKTKLLQIDYNVIKLIAMHLILMQELKMLKLSTPKKKTNKKKT